ncbi:XdhC family protein [Novosphingobium flavum]|uniref:XdhC family protein n=1 Tax=Novosphingobium flavum TaxID=1778672 RepID=A0A7X1FS74_9SPHN|nr:XdhC family protein [Novosphingobium flavum]MBC2665978.1 XdhC family protein [Novosphingobium flavum]
MEPRDNRDSMVSHPRDIAAFALQRVGGGVALVFVTSVEGGSVRAPGLRMAVAADGEAVGFVSNGCVESDLVAAARRAIAKGAPASLAYGRGSGRIDIVLPCGGRIELLVVPVGPDQLAVLEALTGDERAAGTILLGPGGTIGWAAPEAAAPVGGWAFALHPRIRLVVVGSGHEALLLARLGAASDMAAELVSPDEPSLAAARRAGLPARALSGLSSPVALGADPGTAIALMFHDHEWEQRVLLEALAGPAFYIGALGSVRAHDRRAEALAAAGCDAAAIGRIRAPIGLVPRLRDPNLLAVSVLAEIAATFQSRFTAF